MPRTRVSQVATRCASRLVRAATRHALLQRGESLGSVNRAPGYTKAITTIKQKMYDAPFSKDFRNDENQIVIPWRCSKRAKLLTNPGIPHCQVLIFMRCFDDTWPCR